MKKEVLISFLVVVVASAALYFAISQKRISSIMSPDQVVKEFYDNGAQYEANPYLVAKVKKLNIEAGDPTGGTGFYDDGYIHGIDYDPMLCAQDIPESRTYKLVYLSDGKATVEAHHLYGDGEDNVITVLLNKYNNTWNIVDVICWEESAK